MELLQEEVADNLGVDQTTIHNWEANRTSSRLAFIIVIISFLSYVPMIPNLEILATASLLVGSPRVSLRVSWVVAWASIRVRCDAGKREEDACPRRSIARDC